MTLKIQKVNIVEVMKTYTNIVLSALESKGISFHLKSDKKSIPLYIDIEKMEKVVSNLMSNMIKFTDMNGKNKLCITEDNSNCSIEFEDTGAVSLIFAIISLKPICFS